MPTNTKRRKSEWPAMGGGRNFKVGIDHLEPSAAIVGAFIGHSGMLNRPKFFNKNSRHHVMPNRPKVLRGLEVA